MGLGIKTYILRTAAAKSAALQSAVAQVLSHKIPVFHMASLSRSGETVMLRTLRAHSRIRVVHNFFSDDSDSEARLFVHLMSHRDRFISAGHPLVRPFEVQPNEVLLIKQAVWRHQVPFSGFSYCRNPVAVFCSMKIYEREKLGDNWRDNWRRNTARMLRWLKLIDPSAVHGFELLSPIDQFCTLYNIRMSQILGLGLQIYHYERFVTEPESALRGILETMSLDYEPEMVRSEKAFEPGQIGHGDIDLSKSISTDSIYRYKRELTPAEFEEVERKTRSVSEQLGYKTGWDSISVHGLPINPG